MGKKIKQNPNLLLFFNSHGYEEARLDQVKNKGDFWRGWEGVVCVGCGLGFFVYKGMMEMCLHWESGLGLSKAGEPFPSLQRWNSLAPLQSGFVGCGPTPGPWFRDLMMISCVPNQDFHLRLCPALSLCLTFLPLPANSTLMEVSWSLISCRQSPLRSLEERRERGRKY